MSIDNKTKQDLDAIWRKLIASIGYRYEGLNFGDVIDNLQEGVEGLDTRINTIEGQTLDTRVNALEGEVEGLSTSTARIYSVSTTGNDVTGDGSVGAPFASLQGALNHIPKTIKHPTVISIGAGVFTAPAVIEGFTYQTIDRTSPPQLVIKGTMAQATKTGLMTGTVTSATPGDYFGTWSTVTKAGAGWTVNELRGLFLEIISGTGAGQVRAIASNTATVITVTGTLDVDPAADSVFRIIQPATVMRLTDAALTGYARGWSDGYSNSYNTNPTTVGGLRPGLISIAGGSDQGAMPIVIRNITFDSAATDPHAAIVTRAPSILVTQCRVLDKVGLIHSGSSNGLGTCIKVANCSSTQTTANSVSMIDVQNAGAFVDVSDVVAVGVAGHTGSLMYVSNSDCAIVSYSYAEHLNHLNGGSTLYSSAIGCRGTLLHSNAMSFGDSTWASSAVNVYVDSCDFSNCSATPISVMNCKASVYLYGVTGTGNTGYGISIAKGPFVQITAETTIVGLTNALIVDDVASTWNAFRALNPKLMKSNYGTVVYQ